MKSIQIYSLLVFYLVCSIVQLNAGTLSLPYPDVYQKQLTHDQITLALRDSKNDKKTVSSQCPYSKTTFDELFDEAGSDEVVIGGVVTEIDNTLVVNHFDGYVLMEYCLSLLPRKPSILSFVGDDYDTLKNGYKNNIDHEDTTLYVFPPGLLQYDQRNYYDPIFINPVNKKKILTLQFFKLSRHIVKGRRQVDNVFYSYEVTCMGDIAQLLLHEETMNYFKGNLSKNIFWQDKIEVSVREIQSALYYKQYEKADKEWIALQKIIDVKKEEIKEDATLFDSIKLMTTTFHKACDALGNFFYDKKNYAKALEYYEKELSIENALARAARIRLGYMKHAALDEQLKGLALYEQLLNQDNLKEYEMNFFALELAELLYARAKVKNDYIQAGSYIKTFAQKSDISYTKKYAWITANILMGKIYFQQGDYDTAKSYFKKIKPQEGREDLVCDATYMLTKIDCLQNKKSVNQTFACYEKTYKKVNNLELKASIAFHWAATLHQKCEKEKFKASVAPLLEVLQEAQTSITLLLKSEASRNLNDFVRDCYAENLKTVTSYMTPLHELQFNQQKQAKSEVDVLAAHKRGPDISGDKSPKRTKKDQ